MASASIQFSQRHAFGEKKSWQWEDKQSRRNKVTDLRGTKGKKKRERKIRREKKKLLPELVRAVLLSQIFLTNGSKSAKE